MDVLEPFLLDFNSSSELNKSDIEQEIIRLDEQRKIALALLKGEVPLEVLLDCVADFKIDAYEYLDLVEEVIDSVIDNQTVIDDASLILPSLP
ncbi:hypothetical protein [Aliterella atlantica]|uniref:Uncharacterized protein n=1 Tax=Aliterella atlantica CENA595 TaxID=1618023 RepID=A0A0D8ZU06_9CYAN|nr:hypothetical protein [Aliterella atlantica]KJH72200.1 hypothetical protein UH38_09065 [Aliterella atlantica CENA595]